MTHSHTFLWCKSSDQGLFSVLIVTSASWFHKHLVPRITVDDLTVEFVLKVVICSTWTWFHVDQTRQAQFSVFRWSSSASVMERTGLKRGCVFKVNHMGPVCYGNYGRSQNLWEQPLVVGDVPWLTVPVPVNQYPGGPYFFPVFGPSIWL